MSATSSAGRAKGATRYVAGSAFCFSWPGYVVGQQVERALDAGDHAGGDACVARRRIELVMTEQGLDDADVGAALQEVGREAVAERMHRHRLADARRLGRLVEQATELAGRHRTARPAAGKQPALLRRHALVVARRALLPPLAQQTEHLGRQHDVAVLAPLACTTRMMSGRCRCRRP